MARFQVVSVEGWRINLPVAQQLSGTNLGGVSFVVQDRALNFAIVAEFASEDIRNSRMKNTDRRVEVRRQAMALCEQLNQEEEAA